MSLQARHDPLTGALNRKGLEEAVEKNSRPCDARKRRCACRCWILTTSKAQRHPGPCHGRCSPDPPGAGGTQCMRPQDTGALWWEDLSSDA